eukprot:CAMPEP_0180686404 /NCGR_PEP_ID=MMETSP1037_2-20121125/72913_1 /TAXON_ID=632150 /ORGANISM="Azadinium spinosum, Strain 3D9" /LENGTH=148 /DNA_ID=CAMNT_0022717143 /DNA_START=283 /DNA_END=729 /DNA_ORIENTATION=-
MCVALLALAATTAAVLVKLALDQHHLRQHREQAVRQQVAPQQWAAAVAIRDTPVGFTVAAVARMTAGWDTTVGCAAGAPARTTADSETAVSCAVAAVAGTTAGWDTTVSDLATVAAGLEGIPGGVVGNSDMSKSCSPRLCDLICCRPV